MIPKLNIFFIMTLLFFRTDLFAEIKVFQRIDGVISEIAADKIESTCGKNFIFRESHKDEAPTYLQPEIIKASFKGEMSPSIDTLVSRLKVSNGKCVWVTPDEAAKLK